jgi:signal transduction histidine kinase
VVIEEDLVASHLFQIVEEATNNAVRHGQPRKIEITVDRSPRGLFLSVRDDGVGLPKDIDHSPGMGLRTMRYRAGVIGATLELQSPPTGGTVVSCLVATSGPPSGTTTPTPTRP